MTDKMKERARELAAKSGMSYQAAYNQLRQNEAKRVGLDASTMGLRSRAEAPPGSDASAAKDSIANGPDGAKEDNSAAAGQQAVAWWNNRRHEPDCPLNAWSGPPEQAPACECLGIDYSLPLLDGDDYYDV